MNKPVIVTSPAGKEPLQVRIPVDIKRRFKSHAALRGMEPHELFVEMWEHYELSLAANATDAQKEHQLDA